MKRWSGPDNTETRTRIRFLFQTHSDQSVGLVWQHLDIYMHPLQHPYAATYEGCIPGSAATKVTAAVDETPVVSVVLHGTGRKIGSL